MLNCLSLAKLSNPRLSNINKAPFCKSFHDSTSLLFLEINKLNYRNVELANRILELEKEKLRLLKFSPYVELI